MVCLTVKEQEKIRHDLNVSPAVKNMGYAKLPSFYVYRESPKKLYIPRFFGFDNYGEPDESRISDGTSVNINFNGSDKHSRSCRSWKVQLM